MKKNRVLEASCIVCIIGLLAACATTPTVAPTEAPVATVAAEAPVVTEAAAPEPVSMTILVDNLEQIQTMAKSQIDAYMALHPNVTITIESRPGGGDGDNVVKTKLATGEMNDMFIYTTGSLFQALDPANTMVDLADEPFIANVVDSFLPAVSVGEKAYGVPFGTVSAGGILYNKKVFADLGLSVPKSWAEFAANNEVIKAAGIAPVIATFGDTWSAQLFILADFYNVQAADPTFAADYTANKAKYATTPAALNGFEHLQEGFDKGWWQQDYATAKFDQGLKLLAEGDGAQYPMVATWGLPGIEANNPDQINDIGFFALPGADAASNGVTLWMPNAVYISNTSQNIDEAKKFLAFVASTAGTDAMTALVPPTGPYLVKGATLPDVLPAVKDAAAYIDAGMSGPALEFLSPIKGPALEQICVAVGTGQMTAAEGAAAYDLDVEKQAQQLGLEGW
jgi:raffinose/stachyose/melibiose transport system substrate-binding protein